MKSDLSKVAAVNSAASSYDAGLVKAARTASTRSQKRFDLSLPMVLGASAIALLVLPAALRRSVIAAAVPFVAARLRTFFR